MGKGRQILIKERKTKHTHPFKKSKNKLLRNNTMVNSLAPLVAIRNSNNNFGMESVRHAFKPMSDSPKTAKILISKHRIKDTLQGSTHKSNTKILEIPCHPNMQLILP